MITEQDVHAACDALNARGEEPKYEGLREELGNRGSWSTIRKYRESWIAKEAEVPEVPDALRSFLLGSTAAIWRVAYPAAASHFGEERRRLLGQNEDLQAALSHTEADLASRSGVVEELTLTVADLRERLAAARATHRADVEQAARLSGEVAALMKINGDLQEKLTARSEGTPTLRIVPHEPNREGQSS